MNELSQEQIQTILTEHQQMTDDLKLIKTNVFKVCSNLGLIDENGKIKERVSMITLMPKIMGYFTNSNKAVEDFGFLQQLLPLLSRYENL